MPTVLVLLVLGVHDPDSKQFFAFGVLQMPVPQYQDVNSVLGGNRTVVVEVLGDGRR